MTKQGKRWLGALLALCMVAGMFPVISVAVEGTGTVAKGTYMDADGNMQSYEVSFDKPLTQTGGYLDPGNYYLTDDIDLDDCLKTSTFESGTVRIDLAGHILRRSGGTSGAIEMAQSFDLELYDSDANEGNSDRTAHYYTVDENGLWVFDDTNTSGNVWYGGVITGAMGARNGAVAVAGNTFTMYGGTISGNVSENVGGVGISGVNSSLHGSTYGKFVMNGGYIVGNRATSLQEQNYGGGGVNATGLSMFEMNGGEISDNVAGGCGGGVFLDRGATFIMNRGKISGNSSQMDAAYWGGGGVYVYSDSLSKQDTVFTMNGGEISGNISHGSGGGVYLKSNASSDFFAKMTMTGGIIRRNRAEGTEVLYGRSSGSGGGVHADNLHSTFIMSGGEILENHARNFGGGLYSDGEVLDLSKSVTIADNTAGSGTGKVQNVYLTSRAKITASEPLTNSGEIGIAMEKPGIFTSGWKTTMGATNPQDHFVSEMAGYVVSPQTVDGVVEAALVEETTPSSSTGTVAKGTYMDADGNMQSYEVKFDTPLTQTSGELAAGNYYLTDDLDLTSYLSVCDGVVRIDLAGHVLRGAGNTRTFWCHGNSNACSLEIYDSDANTDNVTHAKHYYTIDETNHCWLFDDAIPSETFVEGGVITGNGYSIVDVSWIKNSAKFVLYQGTLSGASHAISTQTSGYSEVNTAEVVKILIAGGAVKGNGQKSLGIPGCAAVETCGTFVMTGGEISNNAGTGVEFVDTFILRGGKISNNGVLGVYAARRRGTDTPGREDMIMYGGEISGNSGGLWGGGIYMPFGEATLDMRGGQIVNNTVTNSEVRTKGGGIFTRGNISLSGVVAISGNTSNFSAPSNLFIDGGAKIYLLPESPLRADQKIGIALTPCYPADGVVSTGYNTTLGKTDPQGIFTSGWGEAMGDADPTDYFTSDVAGYGIKTITVDGTTEVALVRTHTATFVADGVVAGTVSFFEGDTALIEPEVPTKAHYDGAWESYDLASATSNITVNAVYTQNSDHSASETSVVTSPTCLEGGYTTYTCSVCGNERVADLTDPAGHKETSVVTAPTCLEGGYTTYTCSVCGNERVADPTDPVGHKESTVITPPTCVNKGYTTYTCSVCGNTRVEGETAALGHDYQLNADKSVAATPGHNGYEYYECTRNPAHFYKTPIIAPIVTHTATFMVGDEIIDQVVFEEGAATLDEPALPQRPNYVGQWEPYDLAAATSDITVHGLYTPVDPDAVSDVDAGAKAEYENGEVTMELSARSTSRTIKVVSQQTKPVDVVLVLDQSGSMAETLSTRDRQSKRDALVSCANSFVAELYKNAVDTGADHRVAVVGFAYSAYNKGNYKNTGLLATTIGKAINYNSIKNSDYAAALLPINNSGKINANVVTGINSIVADGATAADLGLKMARNIFAENPIQSERERIVIFITDGTPTSWGEDADLVRQTAAAAISEANMLKNGQGAKIYSVGVHANADPTASFTSAKDGVTTNSRGQFASYDFNRFLHAVSSNYPNAAAMSNLGAGNKADGYYMGVKDTSNLGSIFTNILYSTVYELKSFDKATLYYTLSPEFTLTMEQELAMREELQAQGLADSDIQVIRSQDGTTQFRFQNVKTQAVYGEDGTLHYEAKVRFKVSANQSAPAGGSVSTGTGSNGVEYEGSQIASLETPMVSIPQNRCLVAFTINGQVYQLREMAAGEVITLPDTELASWSVPAGVVVSGEYAVFEADSAPEQKHTIRWIIDGTEMLEQYALGQVIVPPAVPAKEGYDFTGWSRSIPYSMPAYDLVCEAIYSPAHTHSFELAYQTGSCREGLTIVYRCACGETQSMTEQPAEHNFVAVLVDNGSTGTEVEKVVCTKCGHSEEQNINFKVSYSTGWKTTVLDLNLLQNEVNVVQPEAEIEMRFFVGEDGGRLYTVTRIDSDGKRTTYQTQSENGYLVFRANHFSIYVISELDETTSQPTETVSYEEAVNILDSKVDATPTAPLDGTSSSDNNRPVNGGSTRPTAKPAEETPVFSFADVAEQSWYYDSVKYVYEKGLMQGVSATAFAPDQTTSRAMIVTILWRLAGSQQPNTALSYLDCEADSWYAKAVIWANQQDVVKGYGDSNFGPHDPITREQLAVMLYRYAGNPATAGTLDGFVDMNKANDYALDALRWATEQGILTGKGGGLLDPQGQATRAEAAAMLQRFCENEK